jgi:hypothetical protein
MEPAGNGVKLLRGDTSDDRSIRKTLFRTRDNELVDLLLDLFFLVLFVGWATTGPAGFRVLGGVLVVLTLGHMALQVCQNEAIRRRKSDRNREASP